jgi:hypothetical protein
VLLGVGAALAVVASPHYRTILAFPLAVFTAALARWPTTGMLGVIYIAAATAWWVQRVWHLVRVPGQPQPPQPPQAAAG